MLKWALLAGALGCAAPPVPRTATTAPRPAPELHVGARARDSQAAMGPALGLVAGDPIHTDEFLVHLLHRESRLVFETLDNIATTRLALLEAGRLNIRVDPGLVAQRCVEDRAHIEALVSSSGRSMDRYLLEELGLDPARYFEVLREEVLQRLLTERVMRTWSLAQERIELRVIVTATAEGMDAVVERLEAGEAFADLAGEVSVDPSASLGGELPAVLRSDSSPLARLAFRTEVGSYAGPIEQDEHWILLQPTSRPAPLTGDWAAVSPAVEDSLEAKPVADPEYWRWRTAMARIYEIDLSPLLELTGEPSVADRP